MEERMLAAGIDANPQDMNTTTAAVLIRVVTLTSIIEPLGYFCHDKSVKRADGLGRRDSYEAFRLMLSSPFRSI